MVFNGWRHFQQYFSLIVAVSFIGGGNTEKTTASHWQSLCCIEYTSPEQGPNSHLKEWSLNRHNCLTLFLSLYLPTEMFISLVTHLHIFHHIHNVMFRHTVGSCRFITDICSCHAIITENLSLWIYSRTIIWTNNLMDRLYSFICCHFLIVGTLVMVCGPF